jgi:hypothetical protein
MRSSAVVIAVSVGVCLVTPRLGQADPDSAAPTEGAAAPAPGQAGSWIHIDPQTGKRIPPPVGGVPRAADPAFSSSHQGLVEKPAPGGGVMIDLQGRFQSATEVTVGSDGKAHRNCVPPATSDRK